MGFKHHFYQVEKELLNKIHHMKKEDFYKWGLDAGIIDAIDEDTYLPLYEIGQEFFNFGKEYENACEIELIGTPLFLDEELAARYEEYSPVMVGKESVLNAIEHQKNLIIKMYENLLFRTDEERLNKNFDERTREEMLEQHLKKMYGEWKNPFNRVFAINLDESNPVLTTSWKYEYSIFELTRLYKTTDWDKQGLIFMGW